MPEDMKELVGLLFIGDPHLASRVPGFRCDEYAEAILRKLEWCFSYARSERLVPVVLGDWFHWPRDNANWLLVRLFNLLPPATLTIYGNHDCSEAELTPDDTLSLLVHAGAVRMLSDRSVWSGIMGGRRVVIGGTSWGRRLPKAWSCIRGESSARRADDGGQNARPTQPIDGQDARPTGKARDDGGGKNVRPVRPLVFWATHHHVAFSGYAEEARVRPREIPGIDAVVNGHLHRPQEDIRTGGTTWLNPGNIARVTRGDASRERTPAVLRIDIGGEGEPGWRAERIVVPHEPFDAVFHAVEVAPVGSVGSSFVRGLEQLATLRTEYGAGLMSFLEQNLADFEPPVAEQIRALAREVTDEEPENVE